MFKALLTDLDGVIRYWSADTTAQIEELAGLPAGTLARTAFAKELLYSAITGQIADEEWRHQIVLRLQARYPQIDASNIVKLWSEPAGEVNQPVLQLIRQVRPHVQIVLVSNATSRLTTDLQRLDIENEFDHIVNLSAYGWIKPQPEIFVAALEVAGVAATEAFFVDDRTENVAAAAQLGIAGHTFEGLDGLRYTLQRHGLLSANI